MVRALGVIPARYGSTRFPGKPLATLGNRTLLEQVWRRVADARGLARVLIATDDPRIEEACASFGAEVQLTAPDHASGTDRVAEVAVRHARSFEVVVNVQGDEPLVTPTSIDRLVEVFEEESAAIATLFEPIRDLEEFLDPDVVKVVAALDGRALYFSRSPIPYHRSPDGARDAATRLAARPEGLRGLLKHQGVYAYRLDALLALTRLPPSPLERDERLEQLRALQAGMLVRLVESDFRSVGVDTPEDLTRVSAILSREDVEER